MKVVYYECIRSLLSSHEFNTPDLSDPMIAYYQNASQSEVGLGGLNQLYPIRSGRWTMVPFRLEALTFFSILYTVKIAYSDVGIVAMGVYLLSWSTCTKSLASRKHWRHA